MNTDLLRKIRALVEPTVERLGFDLVAVEMVTDQRGPILRISIDKQGGIAAADCSRVSGHVSQILDESDPIDGSYHLEVSSPGIERPVQRLVDFGRFATFTCKVRLVEGTPRRRFTGVLAGIDGNDVKIVVDGEERRFDVEAVERAHLVLDLEEFQRIAELTGAVTDPGEQAPDLGGDHHDQQ